MFGNKDHITEEQLNEALTPLLKRLRALENQSKALQKRIEALEASPPTPPLQEGEADVPQKDDGGTSASSPYGKDEHEEKLSPIPAVEKQGEKLLFLPAPTPDGTFAEATSEEQIGKSIYELQTDDGIHGSFAIITSADAKATAMISVSQFIKPVCRIQGNTHRMPDSMVTVSRGEAQMEDGVWTVTKKAVVEFK